MSAYGLKHEAGIHIRFAIDTLKWAFKYGYGGLNGKFFEMDGHSYPYLVHPYNHTWGNERAVEIPVAKHFLQGESDVLELGNVLPHYLSVRHTVVDKYEHGRRVINQDFADYEPGRKFRRIVSVSTVEHIGWDEQPKEPEKVLVALERIRSLLAPGGRALVTIPIGYNTFLDSHLGDYEVSCLRRISHDNLWEQTDLQSALACPYGALYPAANAIVFLTLQA